MSGETIPKAAPTALPIPNPVGRPTFDGAAYAAAALALLPAGRAWSREPGSTQGRVFAGLALALLHSDAAARAVLDGALPGSFSATLPEWEGTLGLPDPCLGDTPTIAQRRAQVLARFSDVGGMSRGRFRAFAAALGFDIRIRVYAPFRMGASAMGDLLSGDDATFAMGIEIVSSDGTIPESALLCELRTIAPAEAEIFLLS